jgi:hypothetical protein
MKTISLDLPESSAELLSRLSKADKDKLSKFVQFWLNSFSQTETQSAFDIMRGIQQQVASKNLSKEDVQKLINESIT